MCKGSRQPSEMTQEELMIDGSKQPNLREIMPNGVIRFVRGRLPSPNGQYMGHMWTWKRYICVLLVMDVFCYVVQFLTQQGSILFKSYLNKSNGLFQMCIYYVFNTLWQFICCMYNIFCWEELKSWNETLSFKLFWQHFPDFFSHLGLTYLHN